MNIYVKANLNVEDKIVYFATRHYYLYSSYFIYSVQSYHGRKVRNLKEYRMGNRNITMLCYAADAGLIAENEDKLQRLQFRFNITAKSINMVISASKTTCSTISKTPMTNYSLENEVPITGNRNFWVRGC